MFCNTAPSSIEKRTHNHGPEWMDGCWDHGPGHFVNPLCDLLTSKFGPVGVMVFSRIVFRLLLY